LKFFEESEQLDSQPTGCWPDKILAVYLGHYVRTALKAHRRCYSLLHPGLFPLR